ncbi:MAG: leucine-rich repeat protein [Bacteroidales bacterium]|nr:leucine-rich repeat protein [Bacteroidales bacterium]
MDKDLIVSGFIQINDEIISADDIVPLPERCGSTCLCYMVRYQGKRYLMKRLRHEYADNPRYLELFRKEYETGKRLSHEHLVEYVSMGEDVDGCYIVMEYVDGETIGERMTKNPSYFADPKHVSRLFSQLLSCLSYLHHHQVLHLDLKPDNIMLTRISDDVKLIDLGFCYSDSYDLSMGRNGLYSAPEQKEGRIADINVGTDLYAVGLLLRNLSLVFPKIYGCDAMSALIERSIQPDIALRFKSADEMAEALRQVLFQETKNRVRKRNRILKIAGIILLAIALFVGGGMVRHFLIEFDEQEAGSEFFSAYGMKCRIISNDDLTCSVVGRDLSHDDESMELVSISPFTSCQNRRYRIVLVEDKAYLADTIIQALSVSEGVERLSSYSFSQCANLLTVSLPLSLKTMGRNVFEGCYSLQHIILPPGINRLPNQAFTECRSLMAINFPEGLESIGNGCFASSGLTSAHLPSTIRSLEPGAFYDCRRLRSVTLPDSLDRIGDYCFHHCDSLLEVRNLSPEPQHITNVFRDTLGLKRTLYVPRQSVELYRRAPYWREFSQILPLDQ